jgi:hypothetical protein
MSIVTKAHAFRDQDDKFDPDEDKTYNERQRLVPLRGIGGQQRLEQIPHHAGV